MRLLLLLLASIACIATCSTGTTTLAQTRSSIDCKELCKEYYEKELSPTCRGAVSEGRGVYKACISGRRRGFEAACVPTCTAENTVTSKPDSYNACKAESKKAKSFPWCRRGYEKTFEETRNEIATKVLALASSENEVSDPTARSSSGEVLSEENEAKIYVASSDASEESLPDEQDSSEPKTELDEPANDTTNEPQGDAAAQEPLENEPNDEDASENMKGIDEPLASEEKPTPYQEPTGSFIEEEQALSREAATSNGKDEPKPETASTEPVRTSSHPSIIDPSLGSIGSLRHTSHQFEGPASPESVETSPSNSDATIESSAVDANTEALGPIDVNPEIEL